MYQPQILTREFGTMTLDAVTGQYDARIDAGLITSGHIRIAAQELEQGLIRLTAFLAWLIDHDQAFKLAVETAIQDYDLVWDEQSDCIMGKYWLDADDGFMEQYLSYEALAYRDGAVHVWIDSGGLHEDHKIKVSINDAMQITHCTV